MKSKLWAILLFNLVFAKISIGQPPQLSGFIAAGQLHVYYESVGKGDAILLLHAGLQDHTMWNEQVKVLSLKYKVITIDLPFHGKTTGIDTNLLALEVVRILLDSLQIKKISIAGVSLGASVVQDFIIAYPRRVNKAFLISPGLNGYDKVQPVDSVSIAWYSKFPKALQEQDTIKAATEFASTWAQGIYRSSDNLKAPVAQYVYRTTLANLRLHKMQGWPILQNNPPAIKSLSTIHIPVLIIDGDKDLPYITNASQYLVQNIQRAKRIVIKDVAHLLNMEKPAEVNKIMLDFLKKR